MNGKRPGGWVALAWRYYRDERLLAVSADAELLWCHALAFTGEQATDGRVPRAALGLLGTKLVGSPEAAAGELVAAGLWREQDERGHHAGQRGGYVFNAWEKWQQTAEQARTARERDARRKAVARENADKARDSTRDSSRKMVREGEGEGEGHSPDSPYPSAKDRYASSGQAPATYLDERGYLFVAEPGSNGAAS